MNDEQQPISPEPTSEITNLPPAQSKKSNKRLVLIISSSVIMILIASVVIYALLAARSGQNDKTDSQQRMDSAALNKNKEQNAAPLRTYLKEGSTELIVVDGQDKTIATVTRKPNKDYLLVAANNASNVLIKESLNTSTAGPNKDSSYYLVDKSGKLAELGNNVVDVLNSIEGIGFLSENNYLYINCADGTCALKSLSLDSGDNATVYSIPGNSWSLSSRSTLELLGVSQSGAAYTVVYPAAGSSKPGTLKVIDVKDKKITKTLSLDKASLNMPDLSPDAKHLVFTPLEDQKTLAILDTTNGKSSTISPEVPSGAVYAWSPDSKKIAWVTNDIATPYRIAYIDIGSQKVATTDQYGSNDFNQLTIAGWSSNNSIDFVHTKTDTYRTFSASGDDLVFDTSTNAIASKTKFAGYRMISPGNAFFGY